eukprot:scaffold1764_cov199-Skeletonema_marinoi.AAC.1
MARLNKRQGFMPGNAHRNLTAEERVNWDKFTDETKELILLDIVDGLAYFRTRPYTDDELATLPQVVKTSNTPWRPSRYNSVISDDPTWFERQPDEPLPYGENFNAVGEFLHRGANNTSTSSNTRPPFPFFEAPSPSDLFSHDEEIVPPRNINEHFGFPAMIPGLLRDVEKYGELLMGSAAVHETHEHVQNYDAWRPFFLNAPREVVTHTMKATTHWYNNVSQGHRIYDMRRSHFPACNIFRRHEAVGTDTIFFDIQAWGGYRCCQFYIGRRSYYMSAHGMLTDGDFVGSLEDDILCQAPKQYIEKMVESYVRFFGEKPSRRVTSPLEKGDHPELDTSEFLGVDETRIYQSMIGSAQWVISIGRFDIAVHIMTLSSFRAQPRRGHLDRIKRVYAYLAKMKHAVIRYRTDMPDVSDFVFPELDWSNTPYSGSVEELPTNLPPARGKPVLMTTFADANLGHDFISGKSVTGLLHFLNKTPFDWFSKKQGTVETATFGSENSAARSAIEQIRANKLTLLFMGVPLSGCPILLGDNKSVVDSGTIPHQQLHKRHLMLSYHFVREAIASGELRFAHINGEFNPSDVLSKHWGYQVVWPLLRPIHFGKEIQWM